MQVSDYNNHCRSIACVGGRSGTCSFQHGPGMHHWYRYGGTKVTCRKGGKVVLVGPSFSKTITQDVTSWDDMVANIKIEIKDDGTNHFVGVYQGSKYLANLGFIDEASMYGKVSIYYPGGSVHKITMGMPDHVDCIGDWGLWGRCTKTCNGGTQVRYFNVVQEAEHYGAECAYAHNASETQECNTNECVYGRGRALGNCLDGIDKVTGKNICNEKRIHQTCWSVFCGLDCGNATTPAGRFAGDGCTPKYCKSCGKHTYCNYKSGSFLAQAAIAANNPTLAYAAIGQPPLPPTQAEYHAFIAEMGPDFSAMMDTGGLAFDEAADKNKEPAVEVAEPPKAFTIDALNLVDGEFFADALNDAQEAIMGTLGKMTSVDFGSFADNMNSNSPFVANMASLVDGRRMTALVGFLSENEDADPVQMLKDAINLDDIKDTLTDRLKTALKGAAAAGDMSAKNIKKEFDLSTYLKDEVLEDLRTVGRDCLEKIRPILDPSGIKIGSITGAMKNYAAGLAQDYLDDTVDAVTEMAEGSIGALAGAAGVAEQLRIDPGSGEEWTYDEFVDAYKDDESNDSQDVWDDAEVVGGGDDRRRLSEPSPLNCAASSATIPVVSKESMEARCSLGREFCGCGAQRMTQACPDSDSEAEGVQSDVNSTHAYFNEAGHDSTTRCAGDVCEESDFEVFGSCCPKNPGAIVVELGLSYPVAMCSAQVANAFAVEGELEWGMASVSVVVPLGDDVPYIVLGNGFSLGVKVSTLAADEDDEEDERRRLSEALADENSVLTGRRQLTGGCPAAKVIGDAWVIGDACCGTGTVRTPSSTAKVDGDQVCCHSTHKVVVFGEQKMSYGSCKVDPDIEVDCVGVWGSWGACSKTCGDGGTRTRAYEVVTPAAYGGAVCKTGTHTSADGEIESDVCFVKECPIDCAGSWSSWSACDKTCGGGEETRKYTVTTEVKHGGTDCPALSEMKLCNTDACAPEGPEPEPAPPEPIDCEGSWETEWSACTATCTSCDMNSGGKPLGPAESSGKCCNQPTKTIVQCNPGDETCQQPRYRRAPRVTAFP